MFAAGRLSEVLGKDVVAVDKALKNLSLKRYANYASQSLPENTRALFQACADGINDYVAQINILPLEFWLTNSRFDNVTVADMLTNFKIMSYFLIYNF